MSRHVLIRPAREADIEAMVALLAELFSIEADFHFDAGRQRHGLSLLLHGSAEVLVAESGGRVVGMCTMQRLVSTAEGGWTGLIEDVVVASGFRRYGIGSRLLQAMTEWAADLGLGRLQLLCERGNTAALDFYDANDWRPTHLLALRRYP
jgi:ribosomal protein S18 acetylase RimI-like enzyme